MDMFLCSIISAAIKHSSKGVDGRMTNGRRQDFFVKIGNSSGQSKGPIKQCELVDKCPHHLNVLPPKTLVTESEKKLVEVIKRLSQPVYDSLSQSKKLPRASGPKVLSDLRSVNTRERTKAEAHKKREAELAKATAALTKFVTPFNGHINMLEKCDCIFARWHHTKPDLKQACHDLKKKTG